MIVDYVEVKSDLQNLKVTIQYKSTVSGIFIIILYLKFSGKNNNQNISSKFVTIILLMYY